MSVKRLKLPLRSLAVLGLMTLTACGQMVGSDEPDIDVGRLAFAVEEAQSLRSRGARVWCVPFARNLSGIQIRGDAKTWWPQAQKEFATGNTPSVGAVMAFSATRRNPLGHVAVVSKVIDDRHVLVDHANWHRNKVSLGMGVKDVSENNDWSRVRVETYPGSYGSVYPITGFIRPDRINGGA